MFVETSSHGGFYLDEARNATIPEIVRAGTFMKQGLTGWYEEDCDAAIVAACFPCEAIPAMKRAEAVQFCRHYLPIEVTRALVAAGLIPAVGVG